MDIREQLDEVKALAGDISFTDDFDKLTDSIVDKIDKISEMIDYMELKSEVIEIISKEIGVVNFLIPAAVDDTYYGDSDELDAVAKQYENLITSVKEDNLDIESLKEIKAEGVDRFIEKNPDIVISVDNLKEEIVSKVEEKIEELENVIENSTDAETIMGVVEDIKDLKTITEGDGVIRNISDNSITPRNLEYAIDNSFIEKEDLTELLEDIEEGKIISISAGEDENGEFAIVGNSREPFDIEDKDDKVTNDDDDPSTDEGNDDTDNDDYSGGIDRDEDW